MEQQQQHDLAYCVLRIVAAASDGNILSQVEPAATTFRVPHLTMLRVRTDGEKCVQCDLAEIMAT